jgi:nucleotide-binding universal stress UspA family protein
MSVSPPYKRIAVASTFSPRFVHVLAEAKRIRERFASDLNLIYVGDRDDQTDRTFSEVFARLQLPPDSPVHYTRGDPATAILGAVRDHQIDLLLAGALEKEVVFHPFLGNVARRLVREATCSVMLFTNPDIDPKPFRRMVFVANDSDHAREALKETFALALAEGCERLYVVRIFTTFDEIRAARDNRMQEGHKAAAFGCEEQALEEFVLSAGATEVPVEARCIRGNTGLAAADFVRSVESDLLVVPVPPEGKAGTLPGNISWITDVIPCNLWVIR